MVAKKSGRAGKDRLIIDEFESAGSEDGDYHPPHHKDLSEDEDDEDEEVDEDDVMAEVPHAGLKRKKAQKGKPKPSRADITAARSTIASAGTPLTATTTTKTPAQPPSKKKKNELGGLVSNWDAQKSSKKKARSVAPTNELPAQQSMVQEVRGFTSDNEEDSLERDALSSKRGKSSKGRAAKIPMIQIVPGHQLKRPLTKKDARGGAARWTTRHLPPDTITQFTDIVTPLAKIKAGTIAPWTNLTYVQVQEIVDLVFGREVHVVEDGDVWCGLIAARISNWRNAFASAAIRALNHWIDAHSDALDSPEKIAEMCELCLSEKGAPPHCVFWWREWTEGDNGAIRKKGMFQNEIILYTLSHAHFIEYDKIPNPDELEDDAKPVGALILALQAVEHAFKLHRTGQHVEPTSSTGYFSSDNYGDYVEQKIVDAKKGSKQSSVVRVANRRASRFLKSAAALTDANWREIYTSATAFLELCKKRKARRSLSSTGLSEQDGLAEVIEDTSMEFDYMSDPNSSEVEAGTGPDAVDGGEHTTPPSSDDVMTGSSSSGGVQY